MIKAIIFVVFMLCTFNAQRPVFSQEPKFSYHQVQEPKTIFSKKDIQCLTDNLYHEARGEGVNGMWAVANVVLNRLKDSRWPNTICGIVYQPYQFSWTRTKRTGAVHQKDHQLARSVAGTAVAAFQGAGIDLTRGATAFHSVRLASPKWALKSKRIKRIGNHVFYKLP